jgi:hypothetical protein
VANKFHTDLTQGGTPPPQGKGSAPSRSIPETKPPYKGAAGPTGPGYPSIYPKVKDHTVKDGF